MDQDNTRDNSSELHGMDKPEGIDISENNQSDIENKICCICKKVKLIKEFKSRADFNHNKRRTDCRECINLRTKILWRKTRKEIFDHYGWKCNCCGETTPEFMSLDHINNDGYLDKNPNGSKKSGKELYLLVKKEGFPNRFQTLCHNCNFAKKLDGGCPHQHGKRN